MAFNGSWKDGTDNLIITLQDNGASSVTGTCYSPSHNHTFRGTRVNANSVDFEILRTNARTGKSTVMIAKYVVYGNIIKAEIVGTDGRDDLRTYFTEHRTFTKI
jgi:hypothetical protein